MSDCSSTSSSAFRARVECVLQGLMARTATEMVLLFEEALRTELMLHSHRARRDLEESISGGKAKDRKAMGAEILPAVKQDLRGEEDLSLFGPVEDDDLALTESPGPSQARDVNMTGPSSSHTAVRGPVKRTGPPPPTAVKEVMMTAPSPPTVVKEVMMTAPPSPTAVRGEVMTTGPSSSYDAAAVTDVAHMENMAAAKATIVSEEGSQTFPVTAVKTEEDDMDDDYEGYDDTRSYEQPEYRSNTDEEFPEDDDTGKKRYAPIKRRRIKSRNRKGTKCRVCKKSYFFGPAEHIKECRGPMVFTCKFCSRTFDNFSSVTHHQNSHDRMKYSCTFCDKTFVYEKCRQVHEHNQHSNKKYWCSDCGKTFEERLEREQHECIVFTGSFEFTCSECNKGFHRQYILKKHQLAEHPGIFSNNQREHEVSEVHVKIEEDSEQDIENLQQDMNLNYYFDYEQDMDLKNEHYEQDMGLEHQDYRQDVGLNKQDYEQEVGLNNQVNEQDVGLSNQVNEQDVGLNNQVYGQDIGLNIQDYEHDIGLNNQVYEQDMGHEGYEQYMDFMDLPGKEHFNAE